MENIEENIGEKVEEKKKFNWKKFIKVNLSPKQKKTVLFTGAGVVGLMLVIYFGFAIFFQSHFLFGTTINGVKCSGKNIEKAEAAIKKQVDSFSMKIQGRDDYEEEIVGKDINLQVSFDGELESVLKKQNGFGWIGAIFSKPERTIERAISFDEEALEDIFENLECFQQTDITEPVSASLEYKNGAYEIIEEIPGNKIDKEAFKTALWEAVYDMVVDFVMADRGCYVQPALTADSEAMAEAKATMEKYINVKITYLFGEAKENVTESEISQWIYLNQDGSIGFDQEKVREYIDVLGDKYNTYGKPHSFKTSYNGQVVEVTKGHYGWRMNRADETLALIEDIKAGENKEKEPLWLQRAQVHGASDIGNTYVEVNLTAQHIWFYKDGVLLIDSGCVTGKVSRGWDTPEGIDGITYKDKDAILRGSNYATPVTYWMPFNGNIGLHDATWRNKFGGTIYKNSGSHGCVNLPYKTAKTIFENVEAGIPVIVYSLAGTEDNVKQQPLTEQEQIAADTENSMQQETTAPVQVPAVTQPVTAAPTQPVTVPPQTTTVPPTTTTVPPTTTTVPPTSSSETVTEPEGNQ